MKLEQHLNEGLVFFKDSIRLKKMLDKVKLEASTKIDQSADNQSYKAVMTFIKKLEDAHKRFAMLEEKYSSARTSEEKRAIKEAHRLEKAKNAEVFSKLKSEGIGKALNGVVRGASLLFTMTLLGKAFGFMK
jgi:hypothetical protein